MAEYEAQRDAIIEQLADARYHQTLAALSPVEVLTVAEDAYRLGFVSMGRFLRQHAKHMQRRAA